MDFFIGKILHVSRKATTALLLHNYKIFQIIINIDGDISHSLPRGHFPTVILHWEHFITKIRPFNILQYLHFQKYGNFIGIFFVLIFLLITLIEGTCQNRLGEAVLTSTLNLRFGLEIRKNRMPLHISVLLYKIRFKGVYFLWTSFHNQGHT